MRKLFALLLILGLVAFSAQPVHAQDEPTATEEVEQAGEAMEAEAEQAAAEMEAAAESAASEVAAETEEVAAEAEGGYQLLKRYFIDGDWRFMSFVLICLILGLAFCIERIITLNVATVNTDKLLAQIDDRLQAGDVEGAKQVARSTPGPTASVLYEGLKSHEGGPEAVEKAIVSYGSVQMGLLERGLVWISLFIAIAPMLGFMGTVIGMIQAFDRIEAVGDLSPSVVAGGIKVALLTTVFGLIVAIILQIFYNYIVNKIDGIVNRMEDASISLVDIMARNNVFKSRV
jgi:biopolymer transport protein ExbB